MDPEAKKEGDKRRQRERRPQAKEHGLCTKCRREPPKPNKARCEQCCEKSRQYRASKKVEVEPEAVVVNGNGHHDDKENTEQLPLISLAEVPVEPQCPPLSVAEEPVKPKGRSRKPQPATASLFDWALDLEKERETEPVGAGR